MTAATTRAWPSPAVWAGVCAAAWVIAAWTDSPWAIWAGWSCGLLLAYALAAWLSGERPAWAASLQRAAPWLALGALSAALLWPLALGHMPISRDHSVHYLQARVWAQELWPHGRWTGVSDRLAPGYVWGRNYPPLAHVWASAPTVLTGGLVDPRTSYAWALLSVWLLSLGTVSWLTHTIVERWPTTDASGVARRWAPAIAAALWLVDPGGPREGGWHYLMFHGVWPQQLAVALWIGALTACLRLGQAPSRRRAALAALWLGGAVWAHPLALPLVAVSVAALWWVPSGPLEDESARLHRRMAVLGACVAGLAIAAPFIARFVAARGEIVREPVLWHPLGVLAGDLLTGESFSAHRALLGPFSLLGAIVCVRARAAAGIVTCLVTVLVIFVASQQSLVVFELDLWLPGAHALQFSRFALALKPLLAALAGIGAFAAIRGVGAATTEVEIGSAHATESPPRPAGDAAPPREVTPAARSTPSGANTASRPATHALARGIVAILLAPLLASWWGTGRLFRAPVGVIVTMDSSETSAAFDALAAVLADARADRAGPLVVAFLREGGEGATWPLIVLAEAADTRLVVDGHVPTFDGRDRIERLDERSVATLGVTHIVADGRWPIPGGLARGLRPIGEAGDHVIYEVTTPAARDPGPTLIAAGLAWQFEAAQPGAIELPLDASRPWTLDGEPAPIARVRLGGGVPGLAVDVPRAGVHRLELQQTPLEAATPWLSWATLLLIAAAVVWDRPWIVRARPRVALGLARTGWIAAICLLVAVCVGRPAVLERHWAGLLALPADPSLRPRPLDVALDRVAGVAQPCGPADSRDAHDGCDPAAYQPAPTVVSVRERFLHCQGVRMAPGDAYALRTPSAVEDATFVAVAWPDGAHGLFATRGRVRRPLSRSLVMLASDGGDGPHVGPWVIRNEGGKERRVCVAAVRFQP